MTPARAAALERNRLARIAATEQRRADRLEDLAWMVETGETPEGAAQRLGLTRNALEKWCAQHAPDLWRRLSTRDPLPLDPLQANKLMMQRGRVSA